MARFSKAFYGLSLCVMLSNLSLLTHADSLPVNQNYFSGAAEQQAPQSTYGTQSATTNERITLPEENTSGTPGTSTMAPPVNNNYFTGYGQVPAQQLVQTAQDSKGLNIAFQTPFDSITATDGDPFLATATNDFWQNNTLMVPQGSLLRGRLSVSETGMINKKKDITLVFDHLVMPDGSLKLLDYQMKPSAISSERISSGDQFSYGMQQASSAMNDTAAKGVQLAQERGGGINYLLAVPYAIGGAAKGTLITTSSATKALFGKTEGIVVHPGDQFVIDAGQAGQLLR